MSFWPFPKILLDELRAGLARGPGFEIGSGDGRLRENLSRSGIDLLTLDLRGAVDVRADARALPLARARAGAVVAGNLLRHLGAAGRQAFLDEAVRVLAPRGCLLILEDDPVGRCAADENYRRTLELLAAADPSRGSALDLGPFLDAIDGTRLGLVADLRVENEERVTDPTAPLRWLASRPGHDARALASLAADVERDGVRYGTFRACALRRSSQQGSAR